MKEASIIILAAGLGTRMKSSLPKVLHEVSDQPMIYHIVNEARKLSKDIHIVLYHQHELIKNRLNSYFDDLNYHLQDFQNFPGTGGAVMGIAPKHENVLI
ncbi:MAG: NTP transferase domain-containing protein, partial [Sulfurospirillaceae bacterium]